MGGRTGRGSLPGRIEDVEYLLGRMSKRGREGWPGQPGTGSTRGIISVTSHESTKGPPQHRHKGRCIAFTVGGLKSMDEARLRADGMEKLRPEKRS